MTITYEIASFILDEVSRMTDARLYITNHAGEIVSGSNRLLTGTVVREAIEAIGGSDRVALTGAPPSRLTGVAFPICFQDQCVGAAILAGDPKDCEPILYMLRFTIETLVERSIHIRQGVYKRRMIESWIANLFNEEYSDWDELEHTAGALGINVNAYSTVVVLHVTRKSSAAGSLTYQDPSFVENFILHNISDLVKINYYSYLGRNLYAFSIGASASRIRTRGGFRSELYEALSVLNTKLQQVNMTCLAGIGEASSNIQGYRRSFLQAKKSIELSQRLPEDHPVMHIYDWGLLYFLSLIPKNVVAELTAQYLSKAHGLKPELIETAETFFQNNCAVQKTADVLNVHKNTLLYRFKRMKELCGLDPQDFQDAVVLRLLLQLKRLYPDLLAEAADGAEG